MPLLAELTAGGVELATGTWNIYQYSKGDSGVDYAAGVLQIVEGLRYGWWRHGEIYL
jgi:hypothetical protein